MRDFSTRGPARSPYQKVVVESQQAVAEGVAGVAMALGKTPAQIMLNWLVSQPQVIAIPKTDRVERVDEAVGATGWTMDPAERTALTSS